MKKKLLLLGFVIMTFALTGCGKDIEGYKEQIYTPIKENIEKLDGLLPEYETIVEAVRNDTDNNGIADGGEFALKLEEIKNDVEKISDLEKFEDGESEKLKEIKDSIKKVADDIIVSGESITNMYTSMETEEEEIASYNDDIKNINDELDKIVNEFASLNEAYEITDKVTIENKLSDYKEPDKTAGQFTSREDKRITTYLELMNTEESTKKGITTEVDKDNRIINIVFADNLYISDKEIARETVTSVSETMLNTVGKDITVRLVQESKRDNPFMVVKDGEVVEDNM
ncbi:hypothetical protein LJC13_00675 [Peptostreptococcaceae bacterium OttesenSCG-928-C18]|nr:hypothetical protein [Peptostreptococcaceae bacterium OttesenSCG-928-C18]